jgi:hypothetical protein
MDVNLNIREILFIIVVGMIIYHFMTRNKKEEFDAELDEDYDLVRPREKKSKKINIDNEIIKDIKEWENKHENTRLLHGFIDKQFDPQYQDLIDGIALMIPYGRDIFNVANLPSTYSKPRKEEIMDLMEDFIETLNHTISTKVSVPQKSQSGWENMQQSLGVPVLYGDNNFVKGKLELIDVSNVEKTTTEQELKYVVQCVLQKENVKTQIILKVHFVKFNSEYQNENNFFTSQEKLTNPVRIEHIYIMGYLTDDPMTKSYMPNENLYHYDDLQKQQLTDPKKIQEILMKKYNDKLTEMEARTTMLDEEGRVFDRNLTNNIHKYQSYQTTRTIFDDMNENVEFS